jgi:hypothetical protein
LLSTRSLLSVVISASSVCIRGQLDTHTRTTAHGTRHTRRRSNGAPVGLTSLMS